MHNTIAWFAKNAVAANLLMIFILSIGGFTLFQKIPLEVFPNIERQIVKINMTYRGASPEEIEQGIAILIEEAIFDLEGIKSITSKSRENSVNVSAELAKGYDKRHLLNDIKNRIDGISQFPADAEKPTVSISVYRREVISVALSGDLSEKELRTLGEQVRDEINTLPEVTQVFLESVRPYEIAIEIPQRILKEFKLSLKDVANAIRQSSLNLSAGSVRTQGGEIFFRAKGQSFSRADYEKIIISTKKDGVRLTLKDLALVHDGFEENPIKIRFNNKPAILIEIYRVGNQSAIELADVIKAYVKETQPKLPDGVSINYWRDMSRIVKARLNTLTNSAVQGGLLVMLLLTLFLRPYVAFWVCVGIPICFMGGFAMMPLFGVSLNIFSLFAFILVLGIVVDDAIVTGENIYARFQHHDSPLDAVIKGTQEVAVPVTFGILTTIAAFIPLLLIEGRRSILFSQIPLIIIPVLLFSLIESKLILPAHLRHLPLLPKDPAQQNWLTRVQQSIANGLENSIIRFYKPFLKKTLEYRYTTLALFISITILIVAMISSGWMRFVFFPRVQSETARSYLTMPTGTAFELTDQYIQKITQAAQILQQKYVDSEGHSAIINILSSSGHRGGSNPGQSNTGRVMFEIVSPEKRTVEVTSTQLVKEWRRLIGNIPGAESLTFRAEIGRTSDPIDVQFSGQKFSELRAIADLLKLQLKQYPEIFDIEDSLSKGKQELQIILKPSGELLGLTLSEIASQVRQAFFGAEIQRIQRGRDDVRVMVRYPKAERTSLNNLDTLIIKTADGNRVPFNTIAFVKPSTSPATITRVDRSRTLNVTADINKKIANIDAIKNDIQQFLATILLQYPGVHYSMEGEAREQKESFGSLQWGLIGVLLVIYALLAIPFKSYLQPLIVMSVIPFGAAGAVIGHWIMDLNLTLLSLMGMLALSGVVVNDSLVLVDYINRHVKEHNSLSQAINSAGAARFRPVLLTSLTTFAGLMPLIFEKSTQAQFLIPMAVSLGFGVLFATAITLILVPINYLILDDIIRFFKKPEQN